MPMIVGFDEKGEPIYDTETRSDSDISCIRRVQEGVIAYFREYTELIGTNPDISGYSTDGKILALIRKIYFNEIDFSKLKVEDPFFNRQTDIVNIM